MNRWWPILLRIIIGGTFIWAGVLKAWDPTTFTQTVEGYRLLPYTVAVAVALYLPWLEVLCGAVLVADRLRYGSMAILSTLLLIFLAAILSAWWRGLDIDCGCFITSNPQAIGYLWPITRDLILLAVIIFMALAPSLPRSSDG